MMYFVASLLADNSPPRWTAILENLSGSRPETPLIFGEIPDHLKPDTEMYREKIVVKRNGKIWITPLGEVVLNHLKL